MGISTGCSDEYWAELDCQWIDITGTPDGYYWLTVATNWDEETRKKTSKENDYSNNEANVPVYLYGSTVRVLTDFEVSTTCEEGETSDPTFMVLGVEPAPAVQAVAAVELVGGGIAAVALLALLLFATRPATRAYIRAAFGKPSGSASSEATTTSPTVDASPDAASPGAPPSAQLAAMASKGVLLDSPARRRTGLSWYRPTQLQLLAAPEQEGALPWSALVIDGVAVSYDEVAGVRMDVDELDFTVELKPRTEHAQDAPAPQHLRMYTRAEYNLWREALQTKITPSPAADAPVAEKSSAVHAAQKWLAHAEQAASRD